MVIVLSIEPTVLIRLLAKAASVAARVAALGSSTPTALPASSPGLRARATLGFHRQTSPTLKGLRRRAPRAEPRLGFVRRAKPTQGRRSSLAPTLGWRLQRRWRCPAVTLSSKRISTEPTWERTGSVALRVSAVGKWRWPGCGGKGAPAQKIGGQPVKRVLNGQGGDETIEAPAFRDMRRDVKEAEQCDEEKDAAHHVANGERRPPKPAKIRCTEKERDNHQHDRDVKSAQ